MAVIRPFLGLRYHSSAGDLSRLVAPPAELVTPSVRENLAELDERNVVHAMLPEASPDDRSKYIRYGRSAARLHAWRREGFLVADDEPAYYRVTQTSESALRLGVLALIRPDRYDSGMILAQSQGVSRTRDERQRLIEASRTHFEPATFLVDDADLALERFLNSVPVGPAVTYVDRSGVTHTVEPIREASAVAELTELLRERPTWVADNVENVEAALEAGGSAVTNPKYPEGYVLGLLVSDHSAGTSLQSSPRYLAKLNVALDTLPSILDGIADVQTVEGDVLAAFSDRMTSGEPGVGLVVRRNLGYWLTPRSSAREPVVAWTFREVLNERLGVSRIEDWPIVEIGPDWVDRVESEGGLGFLFADCRANLLAIGEGGSRSPARSVDYLPRFPSGLLMWSLNDF